MDKKLNRVIGYQPNKAVKKQEIVKEEKPLNERLTDAIQEETVAQVKISILIEAEKKKAKKIVDWINSHKEFKWGLMCTKLGIDRGNFQRVLKAEEPNIKIENIFLIENFIKEYGYE